MALRAFRTTFLLAIDVDERCDEEEDAEEGNTAKEPTLEEVKKYLVDALELQVDTEGCGDPLGFQSCEVLIEELAELPPEEVKELYEE